MYDTKVIHIQRKLLLLLRIRQFIKIILKKSRSELNGTYNLALLLYNSFL